MKFLKKFKITFLKSLIFITIFSLMILSSTINSAVYLQEDLSMRNTDTGFIQLKDNYDGIKKRLSISEFFNESKSLEKMKNLYTEIITNNTFQYYEILNQPLEYIGEYTGDALLTLGESLINQEVDGNILTPLQSLQIGYNTSNYLNMENKIEYGTYFSEKDYFLNADNKIPIVLGYAYSDLYNLGDSIECSYLGSIKLKLTVIGFLKKDSTYSIESENLLDYKIIMPSLNVENNLDLNNSDFTKRLYSLKNTGYIPYNNDIEYNYITTIINTTATKLDIDWSYRGKVENPFKKTPINISLESSKLIKILSSVLSLILFIIIYILEKKKYKSLDFSLNKRDLLILKTKLFCSTFLQIILLYLLTCFILWICFRNNVIYFILKSTQIKIFPVILFSFIIFYATNLYIEKSRKE